MTTLKRLADDGIAPGLIDSAIHQIEFHRKEVTNAPYPYGLKLLLLVTSTWFHGGHPESVLELDRDLERLRGRLAQGPFFEQRIRNYFLDNPHRVLFKLIPDQDKQKQEDAREKTKLQTIAQSLSEIEAVNIRKNAAALKKRQETIEDLSVLPTLARADIPTTIVKIAPAPIGSRETLRCYEQPTGGIFYLTAALHLPPPSGAHACEGMGKKRQ